MVIRILISFVVLNFSAYSFCQTEEQRKYSLENFEEFKSFILAPKKDKPLLTHFHSKDVYLDLYLDTPDNLLYKNNLSLRFRKRIFDSTIVDNSYSFQLKSEMDSINSVRMEVDEKELYFYLVKSDTGWVPLTTLLDSIFYHIENGSESPSSKSVQNAFSLIESWIKLKTGGAIAPFQKLLELGFKTNEIKSLRPELLGKSIRYRSHIYTNQNNDLAIDRNKVKRDKLPVYFSENNALNWLLESSLDSSIFYKNIDDKMMKINIREYEVENKYYQSEKGSMILSNYEDYLLTNFSLNLKMDSKYKQAIIIFNKL